MVEDLINTTGYALCVLAAGYTLFHLARLFRAVYRSNHDRSGLSRGDPKDPKSQEFSVFRLSLRGERENIGTRIPIQSDHTAVTWNIYSREQKRHSPILPSEPVDEFEKEIRNMTDKSLYKSPKTSHKGDAPPRKANLSDFESDPLNGN